MPAPGGMWPNNGGKTSRQVRHSRLLLSNPTPSAELFTPIFIASGQQLRHSSYPPAPFPFQSAPSFKDQ